ncbi:hemerythrin domain-containing protein [Brumimicrobium mesophilum]|uniref:hemerythrin domain-containing protein n=1 Tax=Brumimicrobium mesophilum TaxID=392717 RepID=UPI000D142564|nr:hemerythrin domain-containing protein [Brumimicrobium mesophilum]
MSKPRKPLKRHESLQPFSREHHQGLLLGWKIRKGIKNGVSLEKIKSYNDWFFEKYLKPHFEDEEKYIFPVLGDEHVMIEKAKSDHERLKELFSVEQELEESINSIEEELERHIRFEERELFQLIQEIASPTELEKIAELHDELSFVENRALVYWE